MVVGPTRSLPEKFWEIWPRPSIHHALCRGYEGVFEVPPKLSLRFIAERNLPFQKPNVSTVTSGNRGSLYYHPKLFHARFLSGNPVIPPNYSTSNYHSLSINFLNPRQMGPTTTPWKHRPEPELLDDLGQRIRPDSNQKLDSNTIFSPFDVSKINIFRINFEFSNTS